MKNSEKIKQLNEILNCIEKSNEKILELENLIKYDFKDGKFGDRNNCKSIMCFEILGYLSEKTRFKNIIWFRN